MDSIKNKISVFLQFIFKKKKNTYPWLFTKLF